MRKLKINLSLVLLLSSQISWSQEVVSTQGSSYSNANASIDFTIGEVVILTGTDGTNDITQGFHQTNWNFLGIIDNAPEYSVKVFPNPTSDFLHIQADQFENVSYLLLDANGKLISESKLSAQQTSIPVSELAPGNYTITLKNNTQNLKTIKLVKLQ